MSTDLATIHDSDQPRWGKVHPLRGSKFAEQAVAFVHAFPVGTTLTADEFDRWAQQAGYLPVPSDSNRQSDAWKAHLQRRHELRYQINNAGTHPRMIERGATPFTIEHVSAQKYVVYAPHAAIGHNKLPRKMETIVTNHRRKLRYLLQSEDWLALPVYERAYAEGLYDEINWMAEDTEHLADCLAEKFARLEQRIRKAVETGEIKPQNGGITMLLDKSTDTPEE